MEALGLNAGFWAGKRVLVTGHTGFKGSWLCLWLQRLGAEVTGYALPAPTSPSLFERASVARDMASIDGDVHSSSLAVSFWFSCHLVLQACAPA